MITKDGPRSSVSNVSLSTYFPKNTRYFYGYPSGEDSGFVNLVPPEIEELVAMRASSCAGPSVSVISYPSTSAPQISENLLRQLGLPRLASSQLAFLPDSITPELKGRKRNEAIKEALKRLSDKNSLVMAQPYLSDRLAAAYQIPPSITTWLNDKRNLEKLFPERLLPSRLASYENGQEFARHASNLRLPYVIKISASSSGDGVFICRTREDLSGALAVLSSAREPIIVEQCVQEIKNYGLHFGIPYDPEAPIDILGVNEQLTTGAGQFVGGIIRSRELPAELLQVQHYVEYVVLPKVRSMNWHGVGCFDILLDGENQAYIVDCNFRMTGMSAYHFLIANGQLEPPALGFSGNFYGSQNKLEEALLPIAGVDSRSRFVHLIALSRHKDIWRFNAALKFKNEAQLNKRARIIRGLGITSETLDQLTGNEPLR